MVGPNVHKNPLCLVDVSGIAVCWTLRTCTVTARRKIGDTTNARNNSMVHKPHYSRIVTLEISDDRRTQSYRSHIGATWSHRSILRFVFIYTTKYRTETLYKQITYPAYKSREVIKTRRSQTFLNLQPCIFLQ